MPKDQPGEVRTVPTTCYQCVAGPEVLNVRIEDGVATEVSPHHELAPYHPGDGKVCVKAYGLVQKTYNPNRITTPMKRTNPEKGRDQDPGFVPISWDEALDTVAGKLKEARAKGVLDESGYPRIATSFGGGTSVSYLGTFPAFLAAWGPADFSLGSGQGVKCTHSEHLYGEYWHRGFTVAPDTPICNYVVSFGDNVEAAGGVCGVKRHADARVRGMIRVQIEPHMSVTGACSDEWVPIKTKTDPAFMFAMIQVMLHENARERLDIHFLKHHTSSPYLVAPGGFFMRDPESKKPLMWDLNTGTIQPFDAPGLDPALDGEFCVSGIELGADEDRWEHKDVACKPSFAMLGDHVKDYTPEWASEICDVPAHVIRRVANEFLDHACIGQTIEIDGEMLPFRPVAVNLGKTVNNGWGGYESCWGRTLLATLVGALEVPGGTLGTTVRVNKSARNRNQSVEPGEDGFMYQPTNPTDKENWSTQPDQRHAGSTLVPLVGNSAWSPALGPTHLGWMTQADGELEHLPKMTVPDVWITYRTNPVISFWQTEKVAKVAASFPFTVSFAYTRDETNHMADILLPECTDLESLQLLRCGGTKFVEAFWDYQGFMLRQPMVDPPGEVRDITWITTELAKRVGLLKEYNSFINKGATNVPFRTNNYDFTLDEDVAHSPEEIWDAACRAASAEVTEGAETDGLDYYREHGFRVSEFPRKDWYLFATMREQGLRFELPYQEKLLRIGTELGNRLHEKNITWWDKQLSEYQAMPAWHDIPGIWERAYESSFKIDIDDYPFWVLTSRSMQYSWGANVGVQMIKEVAGNVAGHGGVIMNTGRAQEMGIEEGDLVEIRSPVGETQGHAVLRQGIRPDTLLMIGQFDHWVTPLAKDFKLPSINSLIPMLMETTDNTGSGADLARVSVKRIGGAS